MSISQCLPMAMAEAHDSDMSFRHGAVLMQGHKIVSKGHNHNNRSWLKNGSLVPSMHAEIDCSRRLLRQPPYKECS